MKPPRHIAGTGQQVTVHLDADLVRESARIAVDRTLIEVRDLLDRIAVTNRDRNSYTSTTRSAEAFKADVLAGLTAMREALREQQS